MKDPTTAHSQIPTVNLELTLPELDILLRWADSYRQELAADDDFMSREHLVLEGRIKRDSKALAQKIRDKMRLVESGQHRPGPKMRAIRRRAREALDRALFPPSEE